MSTISQTSISAVHRRIEHHIRKTPVIDVAVPGVGAAVCLKLELLQHSGSFKARGAFANLAGAEVPEGGVAAASGGNHGAAVAYAAEQLGIAAHVFVPQGAPAAKVERIKRYGADVVVAGKHYKDALALCDAFIAEHGAMTVHAYDSEATLNGQGTLGLELEQQAGDLDTVLVAVGGGGLIGGMAAWYGGRVKVIAVESQGCPTFHASLAAGVRQTITPGGLAADSLGASMPGALPFPIVQEHVGGSLLVADADIRRTQRWLWDNLRLVTEPGGATALAALIARHYRPAPGERVGVVMCGANITLTAFEAIIADAPCG